MSSVPQKADKLNLSLSLSGQQNITKVCIDMVIGENIINASTM